MRAGIDHAVRHQIVRQVKILRVVAAKRELQDRHPRQPRRLAQRDHPRRQLAQILRDDLRLRKRRPHRFEQLHARRLHPLSRARRRRRRRNPPIGIKPAEMIDAHHIAQLKRSPQPCMPPREAVGHMPLPFIKRIAPELAIRRKVIRRHARHRRRPTRLSIQLKQLRIGPHVGRVRRHKDRDVADNLDAPRGRRRPQRPPLCKKQVLIKRVRLRLRRQLFSQRGFLRRRQRAHRRRPFPPGDTLVMILQRQKKSVTLEPRRLLLLERSERLAVGRQHRRPRPLEPRKGQREQRPLLLIKRPVIHPVRTQLGQRRDLGVGQQSGRHQRAQIDQIRIARKRRETLVRRIPVTGRPERTNLPIF